MKVLTDISRSWYEPSALSQLAGQDRQAGHAIVSAALPGGLGASPRAQAHCLWHVDEVSGTLSVQAGVPLRDHVLGRLSSREPLRACARDKHVSLRVSIACQFTPPADVPVELRAHLKSSGRCYRSRSVVVPEPKRREWLVARLGSRGLAVDADTLVLSSLRYADLGRRGGGIPYVEARCSGAVIDADRFNETLRAGIGKGKNFGLGLIDVIDNTAG